MYIVTICKGTLNHCKSLPFTYVNINIIIIWKSWKRTNDWSQLPLIVMYIVKAQKIIFLLFKYLSYDICSWAISSPFPFNPLFPQAKANDLHKPWWNLMTHPFLFIPLVPLPGNLWFPLKLRRVAVSLPLFTASNWWAGHCLRQLFPPLLFPYALRLQFPPPHFQVPKNQLNLWHLAIKRQSGSIPFEKWHCLSNIEIDKVTTWPAYNFLFLLWTVSTPIDVLGCNFPHTSCLYYVINNNTHAVLQLVYCIKSLITWLQLSLIIKFHC